jgi:hypothetical protein
VGESEKFCAQLWSAGIKNSIAIGGHKISQKQANDLSRIGATLNSTIVICFDKDILQKEIEIECGKFINGISVEYLLDKDNLLKNKESPSDNIDVFFKLINNYKFKF